MGNEASRTGRRLGAKAAGAGKVRPPIKADITAAEAGRQAVKPATLVEADSLHAKDEGFSDTIEHAGRGVRLEIADFGQKQLEVFARLQANPGLLDGPDGAKYSTQIAAMQAAQLMLPPPASELGDAAKTLEQRQPKYGLQLSASAIHRVPHGEIFPMRPPEHGPGDQLMLSEMHVEEQLDMASIFELFAKNREDPDYWTPHRLADYFNTREAWIRALLQYNMAPTFVRFEGDFYGVRDVIGGPEDTETGRAARRLQIRAEQAKQADQIDERRREERRQAQLEKQRFLAKTAATTFGADADGRDGEGRRG